MQHDPERPIAPEIPARVCPQCWGAVEGEGRCATHGLEGVVDHTGEMFARRFVPERLIGVGGLESTIWHARDLVAGGEAALKVCSTTDADAIDRLVLGAQLNQRVEHKNVVRVLEFGERDDGTFYCAMERLYGRSLQQLLLKRPLGVLDAIRLGDRVLSALELVHAVDVVHRDLKPGNVFIASTGPGEWRPVLLDFGIAVDVAPDAPPPSARIVGTPEYMAPEQILGKPLDARTDIYAFGVLLFRAITGALPFQGDTRQELYRAHLEDPAPRMSDVLGQELPLGLEVAVARALAKNPDDRWPSISDVRIALARVRLTDPNDRSHTTTQRLLFPERVLATRTIRRVRPLNPGRDLVA